MTSHTGGCACGQVRYELTAAPARMLNCHCRDCQRASGSAFAAILIVPADGLRLSGELRYHAATSERDTRIERGFCPTCGSPIAGKLGARSDVVFLRLSATGLHKCRKIVPCQPHRAVASAIADGYLAWVASRLELQSGGAPPLSPALFLATIQGMYSLIAIGRPAVAKTAMIELSACV